jgi:hypothetical protein
MKKSVNKIIAIAAFTFIGFSSFAQQADRKPKIDEPDKTTGQDKTVTNTPVPQIVAAPKGMTVPEQPKPIVPGGEFKPVDTNVPVKNYTRTVPEQKTAPVQHPLQKQQ